MCGVVWCGTVFSNIVSQDQLRQLAEADERSVVKQVQEFYADYYALNPDFFTLNLPKTYVRHPSRASQLFFCFVFLLVCWL